MSIKIKSKPVCQYNMNELLAFIKQTTVGKNRVKAKNELIRRGVDVEAALLVE